MLAAGRQRHLVQPAADLGRGDQVHVAQRAAEDHRLRVEDVGQVAHPEADPVTDLADRELGRLSPCIAARTTASTAAPPVSPSRPRAAAAPGSPISVSQQPREPQLHSRPYG
ncbi:hypothetical protein GCM10020358_37410 [Amorphoplanes nipponensis]